MSDDHHCHKDDHYLDDHYLDDHYLDDHYLDNHYLDNHYLDNYCHKDDHYLDNHFGYQLDNHKYDQLQLIIWMLLMEDDYGVESISF